MNWFSHWDEWDDINEEISNLGTSPIVEISEDDVNKLFEDSIEETHAMFQRDFDYLKNKDYISMAKRYQIAVDALQKQIPMKYLKSFHADINSHWHSCPICHKGCGWTNNKLPKYCPECGQRLEK